MIVAQQFTAGIGAEENVFEAAKRTTDF